MRSIFCHRLAAAVLVGCASPKVAQKKTVEVAGQKLEFGGVYDPRGNKLSLTVNGDPVMSGSFSPFSPHAELHRPIPRSRDSRRLLFRVGAGR